MIDPDEIEWLAAQYALGALPPGERRLVQARIGQDRLLAEAIGAWERRLAPLSLHEPGLPPPPRLLEGILATLAQRTTSDQPPAQGRTTAAPAPEQRTRRRWAPTLALAASLGVLAIGLGAIFGDRILQPPLEQVTAILTAEKSNAAADEPAQGRGATFVAAFDARSTVLTIRQSSGDAPRTDRAYVLWLTTGSGTDAILIGPLEKNGPTVIRVDQNAASQLDRGRLLVTMEAETGTGKIRGPTIASGRLTRPK
ncbi:MAG: hypothetical protein ACKVP7_15165 [Hyphomicrobiaceae bacterium]